MSPDETSALVTLLEAHAPADSKETADLARIRAFVEAHTDPFDRKLAPGHLTGSAFVVAGGRVLLTHHRKLGIWIQLGGHAETERVAAAVALREAREESGLEDLRFHPGLSFPGGDPLLLDVDIHRIPALKGEPEHDHLDLRFLLVTTSPGNVVADPAETNALEWVAFAEAIARGDPGMHRAIAKIEKLLAPPR